MIIGHLTGMPAYGSRANSGSPAATATGDNARASGKPQFDSAPAAPEDATSSRIVFTGDPVRPANEGGGDAVSLRQTARIVALVASMTGTDDISAYAMLGRGEQPETDEYRQVVSAYKDV